MPSATKPAAQASNQDDLDNYLVGNLSDDPFASPSPESSQKKRKANDGGLGIDEEVNVQKRARAPAVKLDEDRLLGETGIPTLRKRAHNLKIKGKGHEFSDAGRLLSFYQLWLDDLFPKAKFLDALKMVEKAGHKKRVVAARNDWINERNPKATDDANEQDLPSNTAPEPYVDLDVFGVNLPQRPVAGRLVQGSTGAERPTTPQPDDFSDDDELYNATPRARSAGRAPQLTAGAEEPEEDELDALMAEAEGEDRPRAAPSRNAASADDGDDLDALIAEAEDEDGAGASKPKQNTTNGAGQDFDDEEAAMREMDGLW